MPRHTSYGWRTSWVAAWLISATLGRAETVTLQEALARHEAAWRRVKTLDLRFDMTWQAEINGKVTAGARTNAQWICDATRERLRITQPTPQGERWDDYLWDARHAYVLSHRSEVVPASVSLGDHQGVRAQMSAERPAALMYLLRPHALREFDFGDSAPRSLADLCRSWQTTIEPNDDATCPGCVRLRAVYAPSNPNDHRAGSWFDAYLDPSADYLAKKVVYFNKSLGKSTETGRSVSALQVYEAQQFHVAAGGARYPQRVQYQLFVDVAEGANTANRKPAASGVWSVTQIAVNEPLPDDAFQSPIPAGAVVRETLPAGRPGPVHLWGADGKPEQTFASEQEFEAYYRPRNDARGLLLEGMVLPHFVGLTRVEPLFCE